MEPSWTRLSALIYTGFSTAAALLFLGATLVIGREYTLVARIGGTLWVFILSMIISMPIVIPAVRKQYSG
ncbi:MAG: hypothetical protein HYY09_02095 [Firmicutes bacterium]|nr:hypothetical protein [Bacillota bacterium]